MCLYVDPERHEDQDADSKCKPKIAREAIIAYKRFDVSTRGNLYAPYRGTRYKFGVEHRSRLNAVLSSSGNTVVHEGRHAYTTLEKALKSSYGDEVIHVVKIPKGAQYYLGLYNHIVADRMLVYKKRIKRANA